jgi:hypothetical protein
LIQQRVYKMSRCRVGATDTSRRGFLNVLGASLLLGGAGACGADGSQAPPSTSPSERLPQPHYDFRGADGQRISSSEWRGRVSLLLLLATHDLGSQLMARQANELLHRVTPRINVGVIVMEGPQYAALLETFQQGLELSYPVVMASAELLGGRSPFGEITYLPTLLIFDRQGRQVERILGAASLGEMEAAVERARRST